MGIPTSTTESSWGVPQGRSCPPRACSPPVSAGPGGSEWFCHFQRAGVLQQWFSTENKFVAQQRPSDSIWRHFRVLQLGGGILLASEKWRPGMGPQVLRGTGQPSPRMIWPRCQDCPRESARGPSPACTTSQTARQELHLASRPAHSQLAGYFLPLREGLWLKLALGGRAIFSLGIYLLKLSPPPHFGVGGGDAGGFCLARSQGQGRPKQGGGSQPPRERG